MTKTVERFESEDIVPAAKRSALREFMEASLVARGVARSELVGRSDSYVEGRYDGLAREGKPPRERFDAATHQPASVGVPFEYRPTFGGAAPTDRHDTKAWKRDLAVSVERTDADDSELPPWKRGLLHHR